MFVCVYNEAESAHLPVQLLGVKKVEFQNRYIDIWWIPVERWRKSPLTSKSWKNPFSPTLMLETVWTRRLWIIVQSSRVFVCSVHDKESCKLLKTRGVIRNAVFFFRSTNPSANPRRLASEQYTSQRTKPTKESQKIKTEASWVFLSNALVFPAWSRKASPLCTNNRRTRIKDCAACQTAKTRYETRHRGSRRRCGGGQSRAERPAFTGSLVTS